MPWTDLASWLPRCNTDHRCLSFSCHLEIYCRPLSSPIAFSGSQFNSHTHSSPQLLMPLSSSRLQDKSCFQQWGYLLEALWLSLQMEVTVNSPSVYVKGTPQKESVYGSHSAPVYKAQKGSWNVWSVTHSQQPPHSAVQLPWDSNKSKRASH